MRLPCARMVIASAALLAALVFGPDLRAAEPIRILCLGSSSMYFHNQPKRLAEWITKLGPGPAKAEIAGRSGTGVHVYLRPEFKPEYGVAKGQTVLERIRDGKYDYVVLQIPAEFIAGPEGEEHDRSLDVYCRAIRAAGGQPVFYEMGWGRDEKAVEGRGKIFAAAARNKATRFAPCSSAWARVRREKPDLELQNPPDRTHPGTLGCYLNLCCLCAAITGKVPDSPPPTLRIWAHLNDQQKKALAEKAETAEFDEYDSALAGWMKRRVLGSEEVTVPGGTAAYLRKVASEEYDSFQERLKKAIDAANSDIPKGDQP